MEVDLCGDAALSRAPRASCWRPPATSPAWSIRRPRSKYSYWTNDKLPDDPDAWLKSATEHPGSWWPDWSAWVKKHGGGEVKARTPGDGKLKAIEDAPGSYVKVRLQ